MKRLQTYCDSTATFSMTTFRSRPLNAPTRRSESIIRTVPRELLSTIFRMAIDLDRQELNTSVRWQETHPHIQVLAAVCSRWREVVWKTPRLWNEIIISFRSPYILPKISLLKLFLENSGVLPLVLYLWYCESQSYLDVSEKAVVHASVDGLIYKALHRITRLALVHSPCLPSWLPHFHRLTRIEDLTIHPRRNHSHLAFPALSENAFKLSRLILKGLSGRVTLPVDGTSITTLILKNLPKATCVQLLFHCRYLELYAMDEPYGDSRADFRVNEAYEAGRYANVNAFVLPNLREFHWDCGYFGGALDELVLRSIDTPRLQYLQWREELDSEWSRGCALLEIFCQRLPPTLISLAIKTNDRNNCSLLSHLSPHLPALETIALSSVALSDSILKPLKFRVDRSKAWWPFPKLRQIIIDGRPFRGCRLNGEQSIEFVTTLASRAAAMGIVTVVHLFKVEMTWDWRVFPGPLPGGEKLIIREDLEDNVPGWYQHLVPGIGALSKSVESTSLRAFGVGVFEV